MALPLCPGTWDPGPVHPGVRFGVPIAVGGFAGGRLGGRRGRDQGEQQNSRITVLRTEPDPDNSAILPLQGGRQPSVSR